GAASCEPVSSAARLRSSSSASADCSRAVSIRTPAYHASATAASAYSVPSIVRSHASRRLFAATARLHGIGAVGRARADAEPASCRRPHVHAYPARRGPVAFRRHVADRVAAADVAGDPFERRRHFLELPREARLAAGRRGELPQDLGPRVAIVV